ncbi:MAG: hypothetical protein HY097_09880 [Nitrospinae bacterium]|nr:hypothetical protein [Nitrospinota bacterium]
MRKIFFALAVILIPMLCAGTGNIPVHAQKKVPPLEKGGGRGDFGRIPLPCFRGSSLLG